MKTLYFFLSIICSTTVVNAQDISGVWFLKKSKVTVLIYNTSNGFEIAPYNMKTQQKTGESIGQCIQTNSNKFEIIGITNKKNGKHKAFSVRVKFNGLNKIKDLNTSTFDMSLVKRLAMHEANNIAVNSNQMTNVLPSYTSPSTGLNTMSRIANSPQNNSATQPELPQMGNQVQSPNVMQSMAPNQFNSPVQQPMQQMVPQPNPYTSSQNFGNAQHPKKPKKQRGKNFLKLLGKGISVAGSLGIDGLSQAGNVVDLITGEN